MSYTLTIESPEKAAWFEERYSKLSQEQLGALFVSFLLQNEAEIFESEKARPVSSRVHALRGVVRLPADFDEREFKAKTQDHLLCSERLTIQCIYTIKAVLSDSLFNFVGNDYFA